MRKERGVRATGAWGAGRKLERRDGELVDAARTAKEELGDARAFRVFESVEVLGVDFGRGGTADHVGTLRQPASTRIVRCA